MVCSSCRSAQSVAMSENQGEKRGTVVMRGIRFLCRVKETKKEERKGWKPDHHKRENRTIHTQTHTHTHSQFKSMVERDIHYFSILITTTKIERIDFFFEQIHSERSFLQSLYHSIHTFIHPTFFIHIAEQRDCRRYCVMTNTHRKRRTAFHITLNHNGSLFTLCKIESSSIESKCSASLSEIPQHMLHLVLI